MYRKMGSSDQENDENIRVPEMEVRDQLRGMRIGNVGNLFAAETESCVSQQNKSWTVAEVRKQVQSLVKKYV